MSAETWGFWNHAKEQADRPAVVEDGRITVTYGELLRHVNQTSHLLRQLGLRKGDGVAAMSANSWEFIALQLATAQTGLYFTGINRHLAPAEVAYILANSGAKALLVGPELVDVAERALTIAELRVQAYATSERAFGAPSFLELMSAQPDAIPDERTAGTRLLYSSGTTGKPKGILQPLPDVSPEEAAESTRVTAAQLGLQSEPGVHYAVAPLYHSGPNSMMLLALHRGDQVLLTPGGSFDPDATLSTMTRYAVTHSFMVPTMFHRFLRASSASRANFDPSQLRAIVHAGAGCPIATKKEMIDWWGPVFVEFYGGTESGIATIADTRTWREAPGTVGRARPGYEVKIVGPDGETLPPAAEGHIAIKGGPSFSYLGDPEKTANALVDGFCMLGDIGSLDEEGRLFVMDRRADLILSGGVNIYPAEVEAALLSHPNVEDAVVFGIPDEEWGAIVSALVSWDGIDDDESRRQSLDHHLLAEIAAFKRPRRIAFVDELPRMESGKINRSLARDTFMRMRLPS